jgi:hypothetical protein
MARSAFLRVLHHIEEVRQKGPVPRELEEEYDRCLAELNAAEAATRKP